MIIRKPFAFIIQKFKLLHFIILIPILYLIFMYYNLNNFFNRFVVDGYVTTINNAPEIYYSFLMIIASILIIIFYILLTSLFKKKNKYYFPYLLLTIFYFLVLVFSVFSKGLLYNAVNAELEASTSLIIRSLISILFYSQIVVVVIHLLLTFGFDVRSGDFLDIREEINLDEEDSEEVEIKITNEDYKFKRWVNRYIREIKYYFIENKNVFKVLGAITGVILVFLIGRFIISLNRIVRVDQSFTYSKMSLKFNGSTLSTLDYAGNKIMDGKIYLAVKVTATNNSNDLLSIGTSDFCLDINNNCIYPTLDRSGKFVDIAIPYYGEKLGQGKSYEYVLTYELNEDQAKSKYKIKILDSLVYKKEEVIPKYKEITLSPSFTSSIGVVGNYNIGDEVKFNKSNVLNTTLKVDNVGITNSYRYTYQYCYKGECKDSMNAVNASSNGLLLVLNGSFNPDDNATYFKNLKFKTSFFSDFGVIKYKINGSDKYANVEDKTPKNVDSAIVLETTSNIRNAESIELQLTIRDKRYMIKLK